MVDDSAIESGPGHTSRRVFLGWIGVGGAAGVAAGCQTRDPITVPGPTGVPGPGYDHDDHPGPAPDGDVHANRDALQFFNHHRALTVDAVSARIIPGTEDDPGAREAAVVFYIDHTLATHTGYPSPAYMEGPFAQTYEEEEPEPESGVVWVQEEELERYGRQSSLLPQDLYRMGLARLDALCQDRFSDDFTGLDDDQQDEVLAAIEDEEDDDVTRVFGDVPAGYFFDSMRTHTMEGFLSDPVYRGNRTWSAGDWWDSRARGAVIPAGPEERGLRRRPAEPAGPAPVQCRPRSHRPRDTHRAPAAPERADRLTRGSRAPAPHRGSEGTPCRYTPRCTP